MSYFSKPTLQLSDKNWLTIICIILLSVNSSLGFTSNLCWEFYSEKLLRAKDVKDSHTHIGSDVFTLTEVREGIHGGKRYVIKTKVAWHDYIKDFTEEGGDLVQDLRMYSSLLGKKAAYFFGYQVLDANHVIVPSGLEISNAIKKFNASLPENDPRRILIGLYPTVEGLVDPRIYRHEFIKNSRIPISLKQKHF
ncbi:MAG: hypothetical protein L6Q37_13570, partial [Bdellovibrionaceae bacterium]|nr:hypothetical protein [Pseudobdellovibrionaceae bacterium]